MARQGFMSESREGAGASERNWIFAEIFLFRRSVGSGDLAEKTEAQRYLRDLPLLASSASLLTPFHAFLLSHSLPGEPTIVTSEIFIRSFGSIDPSNMVRV